MNCSSLLWFAWGGNESVLTVPNLVLNGLVLPAICFYFHTQSQNKHFVEKYFALSWVCMVRIIVYGVAFTIGFSISLFLVVFFVKFILPNQSIALYGTLKYFENQMLERTSTLSILFEIFWVLFSFWYLAKHYYDLCKQKALSVVN